MNLPDYWFAYVSVWLCYKYRIFPDLSKKGEEKIIGEYKTYPEAKLKAKDYAKKQSFDTDYEYSESEDKNGVFFIIGYAVLTIAGIIKFIIVPVEKK